MTTDLGPDNTDDTGIAQHPRMVSRLRLLPLGGLCLAVAGLAVVGVVHGGQVTGDMPASALAPAQTAEQAERVAAKAAKREAKARKVCRPAFDDGITTEPWVGARRKQSEQVFKARIKLEKPGYVKGRDGWKFFTDYQSENFSQAIGRVTQTAKQRKAWASWIARSERIVERAGGRYHVVVAPANWDVYPQKLPLWAQKLRGTTSLQKLMTQYPDLPWIDPRAALRKAAKRHATYEPLDSHWTPYGGYVAWQAITKCLRAADEALSPVVAPAITGVGIMASSNEFAADGVKPGKPRRTYPIYAAPHPETTITHLPDGAPIANNPDHVTDTIQAPLRTSTPTAQAPGVTLLTLRDSTGNALSPLWSTSFGTTVQYGHGINQQGLVPPDLAELMATYHPDVVLFVITERFLAQRAPR
jgi:hypothetical protein